MTTRRDLVCQERECSGHPAGLLAVSLPSPSHRLPLSLSGSVCGLTFVHTLPSGLKAWAAPLPAPTAAPRPVPTSTRLLTTALLSGGLQLANVSPAHAAPLGSVPPPSFPDSPTQGDRRSLAQPRVRAVSLTDCPLPGGLFPELLKPSRAPITSSALGKHCPVNNEQTNGQWVRGAGGMGGCSDSPGAHGASAGRKAAPQWPPDPRSPVGRRRA